MDALAHLTTALAGRYDIEREIGRGGMATVFLAHDVRHRRRVAVKVLNPELQGVIGADRFLTEIRTAANLQHPNLLPLFDSGESDGVLFYVMPFVEGESLRARLNRERQLPLEDAIHIATAVASAVDYAHRHGVVHRDLKPENILLHENQPLVADFGIALAVSNAAGERITRTGMSVGTPQYMSPEQATGDRAVDGRTDVYALGAVLYEMLTGEPPHTGATAQAIIARVLTARPRPIRLTRDTVPQHVDEAVERALSKLAADRFLTAQSFADALLGKSTAPSRVATLQERFAGEGRPLAHRVVSRWYVWLPWLVTLAVLAALTPRALTLRAPVESGQATRFVATFPPDGRLLTTVGSFLEITPTGEGFAYVGQSARGPQLFYRAMDVEQPVMIPGTENAAQPFFSPRGDWIGFVAEGQLKKVRLRGGAPQVIGSLQDVFPTGFAWGADDRILFGRADGSLMQVPANGGTPVPFTTLGPGETSHRGVAFLSDWRTAVFVSGSPEARICFVGLDGRVTRTQQAALKVRQIGPGLIAFSNAQGTVFGAPFDPKTLVIGAAIALEPEVFLRYGGYSAWGASLNGNLVLLRGEALTRLMLVNKDGVARPMTNELRSYGRPRLSPDGSRIALQIGAGGSARSDIWVFDRQSTTLSRLTFGGGNTDPLWTPDGTRIVYSGPMAPRNPDNDLYWQRSDGGGAAERILVRRGREWAYGWSRDGKTIVLEELSGGSVMRVAAFRLGDTSTTPIGSAPGAVTTRLPAVSPDGRYIAYASNETGRTEIYVTRFPEGGGKWQVSTNGGDQPLWAHSGRELFYQTPAGVFSARVALSPSFSVAGRTLLFEDDFVRSYTSNWDIMPDDAGFVMLHAPEQTGQLIVVTNWAAEVRRKLKNPDQP